ncbi:hypothetical protein CAI16_18285 [Virgibacillus dokdonensis]|uniref:Amidohydrolase 3 domain-containing protein n=1 Tax=Virgibacillus dokdonensis TaxID=302167 RepID=A0A3E0WK72_9BACI|nr:amidohydrolase [Virgibacillus dokdonensis]RFA32325.1 hypothetical protein CAI16_18285 [Virgibacillus dokdonensis]
MRYYLEADTIIMNARVFTMDDLQPRAEAIAIKDGNIAYVGSEEEAFSWKGENTQIVDVNGKTVLPGFIESHTHPVEYGLNLLKLDCRPNETPSIGAILKKVKEKADRLPEGEWIRGWGWDDSRMTEKRNPTRWDLDKVAPNHPVILERTCKHMAVCNSKALEISGVSENTSSPDGGHIECEKGTGKLTGLVQEKAQGMIAVPQYKVKDIIKGMKLAQKDFAKWGITTVHEMGTQANYFRAYQEMDMNKDLQVRIRPWFWAIDQNGFQGYFDEVLALGIQSGLGDDMIKVQGMKFMLDGSVGGKTAAVEMPYENEENRGILYDNADHFSPFVKQALEAGLRVAIHGIGERAIEVAITAFERASTSVDIKKMRNRIEHCGLPTHDHLRRMKNLELIAASSIGFVYYLGDSYLKNLGEERVKRVYPHRYFKEYNIVAPGNSDLPVTGGNPWTGIYAAVNRKTISGQVLDETQNITIHDAIKAYTADAAYSSGEEHLIGVIRPSAKADIIVVSENPYEIDVENLIDINVEYTFLNGKLIYNQ